MHITTPFLRMSYQTLRKALAMTTHSLALSSDSRVTRTPPYTRNSTRHMPCILLAYFPFLKKKTGF
jgi:hypothetical protein